MRPAARTRRIAGWMPAALMAVAAPVAAPAQPAGPPQVEQPTLPPSEAFKDPALRDATQRIQADVAKAMDACDVAEVEADIKRLEGEVVSLKADQDALYKEIVQANARGGGAGAPRAVSYYSGMRGPKDLIEKLDNLYLAQTVLQGLLNNDRARLAAAKCPARPNGQQQPPPSAQEGQPEQPVLPPSEQFQPPRQPTNLEIAVFDDINQARTDPPGYARRLRPMPYVDLTESLAFLAKQPPVPALVYDPRLASAAIAHEEDQGPKGGVSHTGSDGSRPSERMRAVGVQTTEYAEVISIGMKTAPDVVEQLIVDLPGPMHPHRTDLYDPGLVVAGVGCGPNAKYGTMCVIDLATRYVPMTEPLTVAPGEPPRAPPSPPVGAGEPSLADQLRGVQESIDASFEECDAHGVKVGMDALDQILGKTKAKIDAVKAQIDSANRAAASGAVNGLGARRSTRFPDIGGPPGLIEQLDSLDHDRTDIELLINADKQRLGSTHCPAASRF